MNERTYEQVEWIREYKKKHSNNQPMK